MDRRCQVDALLLERPAINADVDTGEREVAVLDGKPSVTEGIEIICATGLEFVDDLAGVIAERLAVRPVNGNFLCTEAILTQRPQRDH
jgi:hypothetical protein